MSIKQIIETLNPYYEENISEAEKVGDLLIQKMCYFEPTDCDAEVIAFLEGSKYLETTDYGITELTKDNYELMLKEIDSLGVELKTKSDGKSILTAEEIKFGLGDIARAFDEGKLDIAIMI